MDEALFFILLGFISGVPIGMASVLYYQQFKRKRYSSDDDLIVEPTETAIQSDEGTR